MDIKKCGVAWLLLLLLPVLALGQRYDFKTISVNEGLPHGQIHHIHQSSDHYMWMATNGGGVIRYDGHNFKSYTVQDGLQSNAVHRIFEDANETLLIASDPGGLVTFKEDSLVNPYPDAPISDFEVWSMEEVKPGETWFGTYKGGIFIREDGKFRNLTTNDGLVNNSIWDIYKDSSGKIWIGTEEGLTVLDGQEIKNYTTADGLSGNRIYRVIEDDSGTFWIATNNGITRWNEEGFEPITTINGVDLNYVFDIRKAENGNIWVGTETKGVFVYNDDSFTHITRKNGLSSNYIYYLYEDQSGNMWVATNENGVSLYKGDAFQFYDEDFGLASDAVLSIFVDHDEIFWFGTQEGIQSYDGKQLQTHTLPNKYENNYIWEIEQFANGDMLFLMPDNNLMTYDGNQFYDFSSSENLGDLFIYDVFIDSDNKIWIGTDDGLHILDDTLQTYTMENGMAGNVVQHINQVHKDKYYISTTNGLSVFDGENFENIRVDDGLNSNSVNYAIEGSNNNIWLGTSSGVSVLKKNQKSSGYEIDNFGREHGMGLVATHFLWFDEAGYLWQGTNGGLNRLNVPEYHRTQTMELVHYGLSDQGMGVEFNFHAIAEGSANDIWMGSMNGALKLDISKLQNPQTVPITKLTNIEFNGKPVDWASFSDQLQYKNGQLEFPSVTFPPGEHSYTFSFIGINFRNPQNVQYRFKVEGFEEEWKPVTSANSASYTNLEPGNYTFEVQAMKKGGDNESNVLTASYPFSVAHPFWQTNWFIGLMIIGTVGVIFGFIKVRIGMLEKERLRELVDQKTHHLQEALEEKEVLIKEIHHRVKNNLAVISGLLELQMGYANNQFVNRVLSESQRRVQSISMIHEKLYQNERLAEIDFEKYVRELIEIIAYSFSNPDKEIQVNIKIDDFKLGVDQGIPCGLILNEVVSNAYEHAFKNQQKGTITIHVCEKKDNKIILKVTDNGQGFAEDFDISESETLGLTLVETLCNQLQGEFKFSNTETGAQFVLEFESENPPLKVPA